MDRRTQERLVGASILVVLVILIAPELLSGPAPPPAASMPATIARPAASTPEQVRNITVDLATSKAPAPEPDAVDAGVTQTPAASSAPAGAAPAGAAAVSAAAGGAAAASADASGGARSDREAALRPAAAPPAAMTANERAPSKPRLETAAPAPTNSAAVRAGAGGSWAVQLGSFASRPNAEKLLRQLKARGFPVYVVSGGAGSSLRYRVRVGPMADRGAAAQTAAKLTALGHASSLVPPAH